MLDRSGKVHYLNLVLVGVIVCFVVLVLWFVHGAFSSIERNRRHALVGTINNMRDLAVHCILLTEQTGELPPQEMRELLIWVKKYYTGALSNRHYRDNALYDSWEMSVRLLVQSPKKYVFISPGPNHKYEKGRGDDLVCAFDPSNIKSIDHGKMPE